MAFIWIVGWLLIRFTKYSYQKRNFTCCNISRKNNNFGYMSKHLIQDYFAFIIVHSPPCKLKF